MASPEFIKPKLLINDVAVSRARDIANRVLAPSAGQNDKAGRYSPEAVESLGESGLLGLMLPVEVGGSGLGPRTFATVTATLAEADASVAMVYLMHVLGTATISTARPSAAPTVTPILREIAAGRICRHWPSVKPARAAISGRLCHARIGIVKACASAPRNRG